MVKELTAIDLLIETINRFPEESANIHWIIAQCEELKHEERKQIVDAWFFGNVEGGTMSTDHSDGETYYNEIFGK